MPDEFDYDLITLGAGSGGLSVIERAAAYGRRCALVERGKMGGTCVNLGCVPKKIMWFGANLADLIEDARSYGFDVSVNGFDWGSLVEKRERYIANINSYYHGYLKDLGVDEIDGEASFVDAHTIAVGDRQYSARHIVIATGTRPSLPDIPGVEFAITSDGFFTLTEQPQRLAIAGSGYIAVELAGVLNALGSEVTLYLRKNHVLGEFDSMLQTILLEEIEKSGIDVRMNCQITAIARDDDGKLDIDDNQNIGLEGLDQVIYAIGRHPELARLKLDNAGVQLDENGFIATDLYQYTNVPHIFALGDVTGRAPLTPVAIAAGRRAGRSNLRNQQIDISTTSEFQRLCSAIRRLASAIRRWTRARPTAIGSARIRPVSAPCSIRF